MTWMVYGAYGYTGRLVARLALARGQRPLLAGRSAERLEPLARELGLEHRVLGLDDPDALAAGLADVDVVAHCAGPFSATSRPMVDACLRSRTHYVDVTGEIDVFEGVLARDGEARAAGVVLLPGAGFDVVPTDCLAAMLAARLPDATHVELAFKAGGSMSPGTAKTALESIAVSGRARVDGVIRAVPAGWRTRTVPFPGGPARCSSIAWGDVSTAFHSTGIPNVVTYTVVPGGGALARLPGLLAPVTSLPVVQRGLRGLVERFVHGPDDAARAGSRSEVWGEVRAADGRTATGSLTTPNGYDLTADSVVRTVAHLAAGDVAPGAYTPSRALGADFVRELDGVEVSPG